MKQQCRCVNVTRDVRTDVSDVINVNRKSWREVTRPYRDYSEIVWSIGMRWPSLPTTYVYGGRDPC